MKKRITIRNILYILLVGAFMFGFYEGVFINMLFGLLSILIISSLSVFMHEAGHYLAAKLLGYKPKYFIVGTTVILLKRFNGLFKFNFFDTNFIINPFGHAGSVEAFTYMLKSDKFKMAIICAAGPFFNLLFAFLFYGLYNDFLLMQFSKGMEGFSEIFSRASYEAYLFVILIIIFFVNGLNFSINLLPFIKGTDGWFIYQLFKEKKHPEFNNINIHMDMEKSMVDTDSFSRTIEPIYNNFSDK